MKHGMRTTGVNTPFELIQQSKNYTIKNIAQNTECPTLVLDVEKDDSFPGQPKKLFETLTCPKNTVNTLKHDLTCTKLRTPYYLIPVRIIKSRLVTVPSFITKWMGFGSSNPNGRGVVLVALPDVGEIT